MEFKKTTESNGGGWKNSYGTLGKFRADKPTKMKVTFDDTGSLVFGIATKDLDLSTDYYVFMKQKDESDPFYGIRAWKDSSSPCNFPEFQANLGRQGKAGDSYEIRYDPANLTLSINGGMLKSSVTK